MDFSWTKRMERYAPVVLRVALALVYFYFGISQLVNPAGFIGYLPQEANLLPIAARTLVLLNGGFEIFAATLLLLGLFTRPIALLLGLHLAGISLSVGFSDIGVRDFGLTFATLSICLFASHYMSLDSFFAKKIEEAK